MLFSIELKTTFYSDFFSPIRRPSSRPSPPLSMSAREYYQITPKMGSCAGNGLLKYVTRPCEGEKKISRPILPITETAVSAVLGPSSPFLDPFKRKTILSRERVRLSAFFNHMTRDLQRAYYSYCVFFFFFTPLTIQRKPVDQLFLYLFLPYLCIRSIWRIYYYNIDPYDLPLFLAPNRQHEITFYIFIGCFIRAARYYARYFVHNCKW